jgi:hypothetical protein
MEFFFDPYLAYKKQGKKKNRLGMRTVAYFKNTVSDYGSVIERCNEIISRDFRVNVKINYKPDLLMIAEGNGGTIAGVMILHYTESTRVWEIGTTAIAESQPRENMYKILVDGAYDSIGVLQMHGIFGRVWLVKRVPHSDRARIRFFVQLGFACPSAWTSNFLSDDGYVPFDPFDTALMKKEVLVSQA